MSTTREFSPDTYGDYAGVTFLGGPTDGWWTDRLDISNFYIDPVFGAVLARSFREPTRGLPTIVNDWNLLQGWRGVGAGRVAVSAADVSALVAALGALVADDFNEDGRSSLTPVDSCLRCATVIADFLAARVACHVTVFIEDD